MIARLQKRLASSFVALAQPCEVLALHLTVRAFLESWERPSAYDPTQRIGGERVQHPRESVFRLRLTEHGISGRSGAGLEPFDRLAGGVRVPLLREHDEDATRTAAEPRTERGPESSKGRVGAAPAGS